MRRWIPVALALLISCAPERPEGGRLRSAPAASGPDPIVLRIARAGGLVRAYHYPRLDSLVWKSSRAAPSLAGILAFDEENGALVYLDHNGLPGWIDLRLGDVVQATRTLLTDVASNDGWAIYGIRRDSAVQRLTPSGDWSVSVKGRILRLFPLPDGSLVLLVDRRGATRLVRLHPPESAFTDSASVPGPQVAIVGPLGDRLFFAVNRELLSLGGQTLRSLSRIRFSSNLIALAATPSGDRIFIATKGSAQLEVLDRFSNERLESIPVPGQVRDIRVDPLGRLVLLRPLEGDSAWVVSLATNALAGTVRTEWRADLPTVAADGLIATVADGDVNFTSAGEQRPRTIVKDGAKDIWHFVFWNGFRPRAKGLDQPVVFQEERTTTLHIPAAEVVENTAPSRVRPVDSSAVKPPGRVPTDSVVHAPPARDTWTVSFAAVLSEARAQELARQISVDGRAARVAVTVTEGVRIHRVVLGPFGSRQEAERVGRQSGHSYWVFEGPP